MQKRKREEANQDQNKGKKNTKKKDNKDSQHNAMQLGNEHQHDQSGSDDEFSSEDSDDETNYSAIQVINSPEGFGRKTQLIENIKFQDISTGQDYETKCLYDGGTPSSFIEEKVAIEKKLPRRKLAHGVRTIHGRTNCRYIYLLTLKTISGPTQVWVLGVRNFAQFYKAQKVIVPAEFKQKHQLPDTIGTDQGVIEVVLGADSSQIWPQQLDKIGGMILYESLVTGQKLIQGGPNCANKKKNEKEVVLSALNRILICPIDDDNVDSIIDSVIDTDKI